MPRRSIENRENGPIIPNLALEWLVAKYDLEFSPESRENLVELNRVLETGSAVIYGNHTSKLDIPITIAAVLSHLTNAKQYFGPAGMKHYDFKRDRIGAMLLRTLKILNIHTIPIVQADDHENYSPETIRKMLRNLISETKRMLTIAGSVYGIYPEGTRNEEGGTLQKAKGGVGHLAKYDHDGNLFYVPISIIYKKHSEKAELVVGKPMKLSEIIPVEANLPNKGSARAEAITDLHMQRLANQMPEHLRGAYA